MCIVNDKRTWSFDGKVFGSSAVIFCVICNTFRAFDLGNITLPLLAIWPLGWAIHDIKLKRFVSISSFNSTILCGVGGHLLRVCISRRELGIIWAIVFIATDLGIFVPDAHALINSCDKFESLEKRNSDLRTSLPLLTNVFSSPNSSFNRFLISMLLDLVTFFLTLFARHHTYSV